MEDKFRLQLDVTAAVLAQIDGLKERTHATSRAETVRYALRALQWLAKASQQGRVLVEDDAGTRQVVFPFLEPAAADEGSAAKEQAQQWAEKGRNALGKHKESLSTAIDAGVQAYREATRESKSKV